MEQTLLPVIAEFGAAIVALGLFYKIIDKVLTNHAEDRKSEAKVWREEIHRNSEASNRVIADLTVAIREINRR